ncbi:MAG: PilZ domain-containing protein [Candidatus Omnitrophica bacterium]|nr:PilZ domain-containing protein [Candidatus Omnitrophota bacterium]
MKRRMRKETDGKPQTERRRYKRFNCKCRLRYQVTMEGNLSDLNIAESQNISQSGILINTNWPLPLYATVAIEMDSATIERYIKQDLIKNYIELEKCPEDVIRIFGTVIHCLKITDGSYDVGIHLVNK